MSISTKINSSHLASDYDRSRFNVNTETVPVNPVFRLRPGESHFFENTGHGIFNDVDKAILSQLAVFSSGFCTSRTIKERLIMQGYTFSDKSIENAIKRLFKHELINISKIKNENGEIAQTAQFYSLTQFGSQIVSFLGIKHPYNANAINNATIDDVKKFAQGAQLLTNFQKNLPLTSFAYRPVILTNPKMGGIVRPTLTVDIWGETLYIEVLRRNDGWFEHIVDKFRRYECTLRNTQITIVLCCEDEDMSRETAQRLASVRLPMDIIYTHDVASFGTNFKRSLYTYDADLNPIPLEFIDPDTLNCA